MLTLAFTASRQGFSPPAPVIAAILERLPRAGRYVTGACRGGDAWTGRWLRMRYPGAEHVVIVPADRSQVDYWWLPPAPAPGPRVTVMPPGTSYRDRNQALVSAGDWVIGFPAYPEDDPRSRRSGTWQTIRMARQAGRMGLWCCTLFPYEGDTENLIR